MNTETVIAKLKKVADFSELYQRTTFEGCRKGKDGTPQEVEVSIFDAGSNVALPENRYYCEARSEDGKTATGNTASSIDMALHVVHWDELDR